MQRESWLGRIMVAGLLVAAAGIGRAQEQPAAPEPGRGVARIGLVNGEVSVRRGQEGEWVAAVANAPVSVDDHMATAAGARAEVQFDAANFLRLGANSEIHFAQMEPNRYQVQVARGMVDFSVLRSTQADIEIDTPSVSVRPRDRGNYRITVLEDGQTEITVRAGNAEIYTPRGVENVGAGKTMQVRGDPANPEFQIVAAIPMDDWDRWNMDRDRRMEAAGNNVYNRYVAPDEYGAETLEGNGRWVSSPDYGYVWAPTVAPGWAPYRDGRWAWDDYYGWSWVGYEPWGWAPYHYGRWFYNGGFGWCWWPGGLHVRHYWAPAYVGFFGFGGGGFGVGFGFGNVGWVPLAPYEVFHPWWGRGYGGYGGFGRGGFGRTTIVNNVNVYNTYRNARVMNGVTAVNSRDFSSGNFRNYTRVSSNDLRSAGMVQGRLGISPSGRSMHFSDRAVANVPRQSSNQRFFTRSGPVNASGAGFTQRGGSSPAGSSRGRSTAPVVTGGRGNGAVPSGGSSGNTWRRFGDPTTGSNVPAQRGANSRELQRGGAGAAPAGGNSGGWRRFGDPGAQPAAPATGANGMSRGSGGQGRGNWQRFGSPGAETSPRSQFSSPGRDAGGRLQVAPPMVRERSNGGFNSQPRNSPPPQYNQQPRYSAPQRQSSPGFGGGNSSRPEPRAASPSYGGGGGRSFGGGGSPRPEPRAASPSYGGGGGRSFGGGSSPRPEPRAASPSYGGGGGRNNSGGGGAGHNSGGGGGGHSSGGGGGHSHGGRR